MTWKRALVTTVVAFLVSQVLAVVIHGVLLARDYEPFEGTLLRSGSEPPWQMLFLPVVHLAFVSGLVWVYAHLRLEGSIVVTGLMLGVVGWSIGQAPLFLLWYAQQPWPGALVVKQLGLELIASIVLGITIAATAGTIRSGNAASVARV